MRTPVLEVINSRLNDGSMNWKTIVEITDAEQEKNETRMKRNEYSLRDL